MSVHIPADYRDFFSIDAQRAKSADASLSVILGWATGLVTAQIQEITIPIAHWNNLIGGLQHIRALISADAGTSADSVSMRLQGTLSISEEHSLPARLSTSSPGLAEVATRHTSLYIEDGNIVISARRANEQFELFRVHRSTLTKHSAVFADMFALPVSYNETYDGAPLVHLQDDASDVESLINILYNVSDLPYKSLDPRTVPCVAGALKLATKYEMDALRSRLVEHLESDWPVDLDNFDVIEEKATKMLRAHATQEDMQVDGQFFCQRLPEPASAIRLAADSRIPQLFPAAFYHLSRIHADCHWDRIHLRQHAERLMRAARWDILEREDLMRLLAFKDMIRRKLGTFPRLRCDPECNAKSSCQSGLDWFWFSSRSSNDILTTLQHWASKREHWTLGSISVCGRCAACGGREFSMRRRVLWQAIVDFIATH